MGLERRRSGAVGAMSGEEVLGKAMRTDVRVVERGMEAERSERREVWRRWGRRGRA
jgi:hypothetical protein